MSYDLFNRLSKAVENDTAPINSNASESDNMNAILYRYIHDKNFSLKSKSSIGSHRQNAKSNTVEDKTSRNSFNDKNYSSKSKTAFDVWASKNAPKTIAETVAPLSENQLDRLINRIDAATRVKKNMKMHDQNKSLASELEEYHFKPKLNSKSLELVSNMKPLKDRVSDIITKRKDILSMKTKEFEDEKLSNCTFAPYRQSAKVSDRVLKRTGRYEAKFNPSTLFKYNEEKSRRLEQKKQILQEIESQGLTFKPSIVKNPKIESRLSTNTSTIIDPITRIRSTKNVFDGNNLKECSPLFVESDHPYCSNCNEYFPIMVEGAMKYHIIFDNNTQTKHISDYIRFYRDDSYTTFFGANKYSGGFNNSPCNWPGISDRPPLVIEASKFIIYFCSKHDDKSNAWGFRMKIIPYTDPNNIENSSVMKKQKVKTFVHERLYQSGVEKIEKNRKFMVGMLVFTLSFMVTRDVLLGRIFC